MSAKISNNRMDAIEKLSRDSALGKGGIESALQKIGQLCAKNLDVEEAVFWHFSHTGEELTTIALYKVGKKTPTKPKTIRSQAIKQYITALQNNLYLTFSSSTPNAKNDEKARDFLRKEVKASLHVPLYLKGSLSGVLQFNQLKKERGWNLADCIYACEAAETTASIMRNFEMKGVEKFTPDVIEMLEYTLDNVLKELDLEHGMIRLDEIAVTRGYLPETEMEFINQYRTSPEITFRTSVVSNVSQPGSDLRGLLNVLKGAGMRSFITVPMILENNQVGCIHVASSNLMDWNEDAVTLLEWSARHIARVVDDIWQRQDSSTLGMLIQTFSDSARELNRMMLFDEAVKMVGRSAINVMETDTAFIILRNPDNTVTSPWTYGLKEDTIHRIMDTEGAAFETILRQSKSPVLFPDIRKSTLPISLQNQLAEKEARSARIFPLVYENLTMGAVVGFYDHVRSFTRNERSILSLFANSAALTLQNAWMYDQIQKGFLGLALALAGAEDAREVTISDTSMKSAELAAEIARAMRVPEEEVASIHWAALLHDIGKKDIPESVLKKSGPLTEYEWELVRRSPKTGEMLLEPIPQLQKVAKIIRNYHERYDGTGYPDRLRGDQIPIGSKVLAVTDAYTSMLDKRAYRDSRAPQEAVQEIQRYKGKYFDPAVVDVFSNIAEKYVN